MALIECPKCDTHAPVFITSQKGVELMTQFHSDCPKCRELRLIS